MIEELTAPSQPPEDALADVQGKGFKIRALAWAIDSGIQYGILIGAGFLLQQGLLFAPSLLHIVVSFRDQGTLEGYLWGFLFALFGSVTCDWLSSGSPGKWILGMRVIGEDGLPCSLRSALVRGLFRIPEGLFAGIPAAIAMRAPLYQRTGDKKAHTLVVGFRDPFIRGRMPVWRLLLGIFAVILLLSGLRALQWASQVSTIDRLLARNTARLSLQVADLPPGAYLGEEQISADYKKTYLLDANWRLYHTDDSDIGIEVLEYNHLLDASDPQWPQYQQEFIRANLDDQEAVTHLQEEARVGEHCWLMRFESEDGKYTGLSLYLIRKNVLVKILAGSASREISPEEVLWLGRLVDERLRSGKLPPLLTPTPFGPGL